MYDPTDHTVAEVREYLRAHPDQTEAVVAAERDRSDGEPRATILALAPEDATLPPRAGDGPPTAGSEPTGPAEGVVAHTEAPVASDQPAGADPVDAELDGYSERIARLNDRQRTRMEGLLDDGTDWEQLREDPEVRARFGAVLTEAERPYTAPQDARSGDVPFGSEPGGGSAYDEDGGVVDVGEVRGEPTMSEVSPARGDE